MKTKMFLSTCALAALIVAAPAHAQTATEGQGGAAGGQQQIQQLPPAPGGQGGAPAQGAQTTPPPAGQAQPAQPMDGQPQQAQPAQPMDGQTQQAQPQQLEVQTETVQTAQSQLEMEGGFIVRQAPTQVMGSNLMDARVITINDESLGTVNDVLLDEQGMVVGIVVGVGGFLGIGQKDVGIPLQSAQIIFGTDAEQTATGTTATTGTGGAGGTGMTGGAWGGGGGRIQQIVVDFTRDQLEDAPEFARFEDRENVTATGATDGAPAGGTGMGAGAPATQPPPAGTTQQQ